MGRGRGGKRVNLSVRIMEGEKVAGRGEKGRGDSSGVKAVGR